MFMKKIIECVPNYSEGRDISKVEKIVDCFRGKTGVKLLDYSSDADHNRSVVTVIGEPDPLVEAVVCSIGVAMDLIDLNKHKGQHPRMGAVDVIPYIPIRNVGIRDADECAKKTGELAASRFGLPVILYEKSASAPHRSDLAEIRKGEFEGMAAKLRDARWKSDFGPDTIHPTAGVTAIGARMPLIAYNIKLGTSDLSIATEIAKKIRHRNGGFRYCKAMGVELKDRGIVEVSMNLTDYDKTAIYRVFETVRMECRRYGVQVIGSEIVGLVPMKALIESAAYYLGLENFSAEQILENRIWMD
ncbi:MAG TPA: glutamate formimidoyltransferase [Clostridia bacterium]|nr:glutamate formimidoyltransferase [Clostridia bacterium]